MFIAFIIVLKNAARVFHTSTTVAIIIEKLAFALYVLLAAWFIIKILITIIEKYLGKYADEYQKELSQKTQKRGRRNSSSIKTDNIAVQQWGHMRKLQGRAYIQSQLPDGMKSNEIK